MGEKSVWGVLDADKSIPTLEEQRDPNNTKLLRKELFPQAGIEICSVRGTTREGSAENRISKEPTKVSREKVRA